MSRALPHRMIRQGHHGRNPRSTAAWLPDRTDRAAVNLARQRLTDDVTDLLRRRGAPTADEAPQEPDWRALADLVRRHRRGTVS